MSTLPILVTALTAVDGRERQAVEHIGRTIREAGHIPTGKRGGGAPKMTPREAANLIIALNGADSPKDCPVAVDRFRSLRQWYKGSSKDFRIYLESFEGQPETMGAVADCHTFGSALECLIDGVPDLMASFHAYAIEQYPGNDPKHWDTDLLSAFRLSMFGIEVSFLRYATTIDLFSMDGSERRVQCRVQFMQDQERDAGFYGAAWPDRRVESKIGTATLIAAWQALHPGASLPGIPASDASESSDH